MKSSKRDRSLEPTALRNTVTRSNLQTEAIPGLVDDVLSQIVSNLNIPTLLSLALSHRSAYGACIVSLNQRREDLGILSKERLKEVKRQVCDGILKLYHYYCYGTNSHDQALESVSEDEMIEVEKKVFANLLDKSLPTALSVMTRIQPQHLYTKILRASASGGQFLMNHAQRHGLSDLVIAYPTSPFWSCSKCKALGTVLRCGPELLHAVHDISRCQADEHCLQRTVVFNYTIIYCTRCFAGLSLHGAIHPECTSIQFDQDPRVDFCRSRVKWNMAKKKATIKKKKN